MRALIFEGPRRVALGSVPDPAPQAPGDAVVRVRLAGVCGSDLHVYRGDERGLDAGTVMGHEFVGEVVAAGREVRRFPVGSPVLAPFSTCCGACRFCAEGLTSRCVEGRLFGWVASGAGLHGAQAEYVRVPLADSTLVAIPEGCGDEPALLLGDVLSTGFFCARLAGVRPGGAYAVLGCGPVGLMAVVAARELGAARLWAVDAVDERLALAGRLGAEPLDLRAGQAVAAIREATAGHGVDAVLEAVGSPQAGRLALDLVRPGGTIGIVGVHNEPAFPFSPAEAYDRNLTLRIGRCPARALLEELVPLAQRRGDELAQVISHRLPLDAGPRGYEIFDRKLDGCTKVVLRP